MGRNLTLLRDIPIDIELTNKPESFPSACAVIFPACDGAALLNCTLQQIGEQAKMIVLLLMRDTTTCVMARVDNGSHILEKEEGG